MALVPDLSIVIPAYNEEQRLERTLRDAVSYFRGRSRAFELIVVDDGSRDETSALVRRLSDELPEIQLIRLAANHGKGYAVRTGVVNARGKAVLFADADGATPFEEIERLESALAEGAEVAVGSRAFEAQGVRIQAKVYRRVMGRLFHALVEVLTVRNVKDTQCGFKLFRAEAAEKAFAPSRLDGFSFDVEALFIARRHGCRIAEVPVTWRNDEATRVGTLKGAIAFADLARIRWNDWRGAYDGPATASADSAL
jgi:dolichyl-phosphate beta-glucosyltransferase